MLSREILSDSSLEMDASPGPVDAAEAPRRRRDGDRRDGGDGDGDARWLDDQLKVPRAARSAAAARR